MTGLHTVRKNRKDGPRWYVYAWRGGPCIHQQDGARPEIGTELLDKAMLARRKPIPTNSIANLIREYRDSPEYKTKATQTRRDYDRLLDRIEQKFGPAPLGAFDDRRMRKDIIIWRNEWESQPRTADKLVVMLGTLLGMALERGMVGINVAHGIKLLHTADKSDLIWEERHWIAMKQSNAPAHLMDALTLAKLTGLRLGDLVALDWNHVGKNAIVLVTHKRKGRAVIPMTRELRAHLDSRPHREGPVLLNSRGKRWTESGLGSVFQKKQPDGFDRTIHDLRGTFVTYLALKDLTDEQIARIVGWTAKRVAEVRARYVDETRVVIALGERLSA